ncbi:hypothetical protein [Ruegeria sp. HKCCE3926]|uniref:hypothetical protein n=1 Tax=Ruegeria sp. HKCCE3926 TaxID=2794831 RepID=UPI001AE13E02|nr:hypothetical protein [Ruegeria sp. HKCCE3926]
MPRNVVKIAEVESPADEVSVCPSDLTGQWAEAFQQLADIVSVQSGLWPADANMIATVVRAQRRAAIHEQLSLEALQAQDMDEFGKQSKLANAAASSARSGLTQLKAHPQVRAGRTAKQEGGKIAGAKSESWRDML